MTPPQPQKIEKVIKSGIDHRLATKATPSSVLTYVLYKMEEKTNWKVNTTKQLNRTLPFDTDTAIRFVRELGENRPVCNTTIDPTSEDATTERHRLTGEEARSFYESIVAFSDKEATDIPVPTTYSQIRKKSQNSVKRKTALTNPLPSKVAMFRYAQDGDLVKLSAALSTGHCDINMTDQFDWTLLMTAATAGHVTTVQYLLDKGAKWEGLEDKRSMNAVELARFNGYHTIADYIMHYNSLQEPIKPDSGTIMSKLDSSQKLLSSFQCDICKQVIRDTPTLAHSVSISHQFACQHKTSSSPYGLSQSNKGFQIMVKSGWDPEKGLGSEGQGRKYPIKTVLKRDRLGVGITSSSNVPRVTHFRPGDVSAVRGPRERKRAKLTDKTPPPANRKERERRLRKERRWEIGIRQYMSMDY